MTDDHDLLGIKADANPSEVRAAYIAALKRLHPDASGNVKDAQRVSDLVSAYRRLRDPAAGKRPPSAASQISLRANRRAMMPPIRPDSPALFWGRFLALALVVGALLSAALVTYPEQRRKVFAPAVSSGTPEMPAEWAQPDEGIVRQAVGALQSFRPEDGAPALEAHSRRCFGELEATRDFQLLDYCLAFDMAAAQTDVIARMPASDEPGFFDPAQIRARHSGALRLLIGDTRTRQIRRSRIESQTVSALASAVAVNDLDRWPQ